MPSNLYQAAVASLSDEERNAFVALETWLEAVTTGAHRPVQSLRVVENLRAECHLLGDNAWGDPRELAEFLKRCAEEHGTLTSDLERYDGYEGQCTAHQGKGLRIDPAHLPPVLLRYVRSRELVGKLVEKILGDAARADFQTGRLTVDDALEQVADSWDPAALEDEDRLGADWDQVVFATFEHPAGAPRDQALGMAEALALPVRPRREEILVELSYGVDSAPNHRFPTIADAGLAHEFQPAPEVEPNDGHPGSRWGWTRPFGSWPPQPELVHDNVSLKVLDGPPRFLGRYTL
jgi:hypothetical protein